MYNAGLKLIVNILKTLAEEFLTATSSELRTRSLSMFGNILCKNFTRIPVEVLLPKFAKHADTGKFFMHVLVLCKHELLIISPEVSQDEKLLIKSLLTETF